MPKVQEYLPEVEAQGPVGQTSPMTEEASMFGRGMESAGRDIEDAGTIVHQRQTQEETSNAYADVAEQRANMMMRVQEETANGTLDVDQIKQDYQDWSDKQLDSLTTAGGKDAFNRAAARAGGSILQTAARGQAVMAGAKAKDNLTTLMNSNSSMAMNDPSQFADLRDGQTEAIQAQVDSGAISQPVAERMRQGMDLELAKGAVRGYMQSDYNKIKSAVMASGGKIDPNEDSLNSARTMLDSGGFDQFLDSDNKKALQNEIRSNQQAAQAAGGQALNQRQIAVAAQGEQFKVQSFEKLQTNSLDPASVTNAARSGIISSDEQLKMYHLINESGKGEMATNPAVKNNIMNRVLSPDNDPQHISDPMQVAYMVKDGMLSTQDFHQISQAIQMVPSNRVNSFNEGQLLQKAQAAIGTSDPNAQYKLMQFTNEVQQAKQTAMKSQQPIGPLLDPNSNQYLGNQIQKYVATPQDILKAQADKVRGTAVAPTNIQTQPGVIPTPSQPGFLGGFSTPAPGASIAATKPEDIANMDLASLQKLPPSSLNPAQKAAAATRWRQLKAVNK